MNIFLKKIGRVFLGIMFILPFFTVAQNISVENVVSNLNPVSLFASPENPAPLSRVTIQARSARFSIDESTIRWIINGREVRAGIGVKEMVLNVGRAGTVLTVEVEVTHKKFGTFRAIKTFRPADVSLLWEADTYAPAFYRGKALPASEAGIQVTALPSIVDDNGRLVPTSQLVYRWRVDGKTKENESGYGRNTITIEGAKVYETQPVEVEVSTLDRAIVAQTAVSIASVKPEIIFYENRPLEGVAYDTALSGTFTMRGEEMILRAEPYFFSHSEPVNTLWMMNGQKINPAQNESGWQEVILRKPEEIEGGASRIALDVNASNRFLQFGSAGLLVQFGNTASFFGNLFEF